MSKNTIKLIVAALMGAAATTMVVTHLPSSTPSAHTTTVGMGSDPIPMDTPMVEDTTSTTTTPEAELIPPTTMEVPPTTTPPAPTTSTTRPAPTTTTTTVPVVTSSTTLVQSTPSTSTPPVENTPVVDAGPCPGDGNKTLPAASPYTKADAYFSNPTVLTTVRFNRVNHHYGPATLVVDVTYEDQTTERISVQHPDTCSGQESRIGTPLPKTIASVAFVEEVSN